MPGSVLAKRYRIISLLGRGAMGEVYRADDIKLGQPVALKFLPDAVQGDHTQLSRFVNEVKIALRVTHPNVCRVYDIGEVGGQHYLSMEYVDGEDLDSLLRRIGRLPQKKAVQIAHQLCAGLAAAHEQGVLHRDLKPANVMIDGRGRAKITDFGVASLAKGIGPREVCGTPGYMAPEQLAGEEVTVRSDLYSLGSVLYELFTGTSAFQAATLEGFLRLQRESTPTNPSTYVEALDPAVERTIMCCLERDPRDRPTTALGVSAALPSDDPLAAALAAGETPSPEMVAASGGVGALKPAVAVLLLVLLIVGMPLSVPFRQAVFPSGQVRLDKPPEALVVEAMEIIRLGGHEAPGRDGVYWFTIDPDYYGWEKGKGAPRESSSALSEIRPPPIHFWYRQSPRYLSTKDLRVARDDPAPIDPGMASVTLDPAGRLLRFRVVPPALVDSESLGEGFEWSRYFNRAGLHLGSFTATEPIWNPLLDCDYRAAWLGSYPDRPEIPMRVEVGAYRGTPVYFEVIPPWRTSRRTMEAGGAESVASATPPKGIWIALSILGIVSAPLALRNLRRGRGDRRGAFRLAAFVFLVKALSEVLLGHHIPAVDEAARLLYSLALTLLVSAVFWMSYIALEPYVRRLWPEVLISWSRLLAGRIRDPRIGRDILIGGVYGVSMGVLGFVFLRLLPSWLGLPGQGGVSEILVSLVGVRHAAGAFLMHIFVSLFLGILNLMAILVLRLSLHKMWAATIGFLLIFMLLFTFVAFPRAVFPIPIAAVLLINLGITLFVLIRFGLLAVVMGTLIAIQGRFVLTIDISSWYFGRSLFVLLAFAALIVYGFYISLAGRPMFKGPIPEYSHTYRNRAG